MSEAKNITILDSTLRDGAQGEGISFSVRDKLSTLEALDELGFTYIEAGNPASNVKDGEFFREAKKVALRSAKLVAFGSTARKGVPAEKDEGLKSLVEAGTDAVTVFGKAWDFHATDILGVTLEENLDMIARSVSFLVRAGKEVIFDAEHFFDGAKANEKYALECVRAAAEAGAGTIVLCDTNGGCFFDEISRFTRAAKEVAGRATLGIHAHDDAGMAVANTIAAVEAGARHVQGTLLGIGERCGNANLSAIVADLQLKRGYNCLPGENLASLTPVCHRVAEICNVRLRSNMPYVGKSAFAHKAGMHADGVSKAPCSFEHVSPECVGNSRRFLMSEVAGRSAIIDRIKRIDPSIGKDSPVTAEIVRRVKEMEFGGYQFEGAEASFELLIRKTLGEYKPFFAIEKFKTIGEQISGEEYSPATAVVKVAVGGESEISAAEGNGPVNALDVALRRSLERFFPEIKELTLTDYKVRIIDSRQASSAKTRVLIESSDGRDTWTTVGVSRDIIEASLLALIDAVEYKLIKDGVKP